MSSARIQRTEEKIAEEKAFRFIRWRDTKNNKEYQQVVRRQFELQWARIFKLKTRKQAAKLKLPVQFIKEPIGLVYLNHAKHINNGDWEALQFSDPHFIENTYKALRANLIALERMVTAQMLYYAIQEYREDNRKTFNSISCDEEGGANPYYSPAKISYQTAEKLNNFKNKIKEMADADKYYFLINFSKKRELALMLDWIYRLRDASLLKPIQDILVCFIKYKLMRKLTDTEIATLVGALKKNGIQAPEIRDELQQFYLALVKDMGDKTKLREVQLSFSFAIIYYEFELKEWILGAFEKTNVDKRDRDRDSGHALVAFLDIFVEQGPSIAISPDFNEEDINSPFISLVLPTVRLHNTFLSALFGKEASFPHFSLAPISTRMINECDAKDQTRPVELMHPHVSSPKIIHGAYAHDFLIIWHDKIFHGMRNSINDNKKYYRYLKQLLICARGFEMDKRIWTYTDLDAGTDSYRRHIKELEAKNAHKDVKEMRAIQFVYHLQEMIGSLWVKFSHDAAIVYLDMAINPQNWRVLFEGRELEEFILEKMKIVMATQPQFNDIFFKKTLLSARTLIKNFQNHSIPFYVLMMQFENSVENYWIREILVRLDKNNLLMKLLCWEKDLGLFFRKKYLASDNHEIEKLDADVFLVALFNACYVYSKDVEAGNMLQVYTEVLQVMKDKDYEITFGQAKSLHSTIEYYHEKQLQMHSRSSITGMFKVQKTFVADLKQQSAVPIIPLNGITRGE